MIPLRDNIPSRTTPWVNYVIIAQSSGIAWWAHIRGFAVGFVIAWLLKRSDSTTPAVETVRLNSVIIHL